MRGEAENQSEMFSCVSPADRVPADHPLRPIREMALEAIRGLSSDFDEMYSAVGRPSIPPERLLLALILQYLYGIRSERLLMEQLNYNLLFRWFVGLNADEPVWVPTVFTKNRERLLERKIATRFLEQVVAQARAKKLTSNEHFSADGTLLKAWASQKSFRRKDDDDSDGGSGSDFRGKERKNDTHESKTDPDARLYRKSDGQESRLAYLGHVVIENRNGLVVGAQVTHADGYGERIAAIDLMAEIPRSSKATLGADKAYDTDDFVDALRFQSVTPHVAQNVNARRSSAIDARTTRHEGYATSQICRKAAERPFAWAKSVAGLVQVKHRRRARVDWVFTFGMAVFNLVRMRTLCAVPS
jgi:transposase